MCPSKSPILVTLAFDPEEMARRGRIGAHVTHSRHDGRQITAAAREAFLAKFEQEVDPEGVLPPEERRRRAEHARRAHMARMARLSTIARGGVTPSPKTLTTEREAASVAE